VSTTPETWAKDIFNFYYKLQTGFPFKGNLINLSKYSGLKDEQRLSDIVNTVRALAVDLESANLLGRNALAAIPNSADLIRKVAQVYAAKLDAVINSSKFNKAESPAAIGKATNTKLMLAKYRNEITKMLLK
jgi:hypothetical protein